MNPLIKYYCATVLVLIAWSSFGQQQIGLSDAGNPAFDTRHSALFSSLAENTDSTFRQAALIAFSHYPELAKTHIVFQKASIKMTLSARPVFFSALLRSKKKRKYIIRINNCIGDSIINFDSVPFKAKIGALGHEFAHITDYSHRNVLQLFGRLFDYTGKKSRARFEHEIDSITIGHGLGWRLYDWATYVLDQSNASGKYKHYKREIYLRPEQIIALMDQEEQNK